MPSSHMIDLTRVFRKFQTSWARSIQGFPIWAKRYQRWQKWYWDQVNTKTTGNRHVRQLINVPLLSYESEAQHISVDKAKNLNLKHHNIILIDARWKNFNPRECEGNVTNSRMFTLSRVNYSNDFPMRQTLLTVPFHSMLWIRVIENPIKSKPTNYSWW